jgi:hypothetical protein
MIIGAHSIIYSKNHDADRVFLRDILKLPNVDVGGGWLIFGLPPAEVAVHPSNENDVHEFYLMCDDLQALIAQMRAHNIECGPVHDMDWGVLTQVNLPGGGKLGIYQPKHARPKSMVAKESRKASRRTTTKSSRTAAKKVSKAAKRPTQSPAKARLRVASKRKTGRR